jgi:hypothetical protein
MVQSKLSQEKTNKQLQHRKIQTKLLEEKTALGDDACSKRAAPRNTQTADVHQKLPIATRHGQKYASWPSRMTQQERTTQALDSHATFTDLPHRRSKWLQHQKTTTNKTGGCVSNRRRRKITDLAAKKSDF